MATKIKRSVLDRAIEATREHLRLREDPTLEQVGNIIGVKQPSVSEWATGSMRMKSAIDFATRTGVCVEWLLTERGPKRPPPVGDPNASRLVGAWPHLSDLAKGRILQIADDDLGATPIRHTVTKS